MRRLVMGAMVALAMMVPGAARAESPQGAGELVPRGDADAMMVEDGWNAAPDAVRAWKEPIVRWSAERGLDPLLVAAVVWQESEGNPWAVNPATRASGLMQIMPRDAGMRNAQGVLYFQDRPTSRELTANPELNISWGTLLLVQAAERAGSWRITDMLHYYTGGHSPQPYLDKLETLRAAVRFAPAPSPTYVYTLRPLE